MRRHPFTLTLTVLAIFASSCGDAEESLEAGGTDNGFIGEYAMFDTASNLSTYQASLILYHDEIRRCMVAEGFEYVYIADDQTAIWPEQYLNDIDSGLSEAEYASRYGFGVIPVILIPVNGNASPDPGSEDFDEEEFDIRLEAADERVAKLPDEDTPEGAAYWKALDGTEGDPGCQPLAGRKYLAGFVAIINSQDEIRRRQVQFLSDIEVIAHYESWRECMAAKGFGGYDAPMAAQMAFTQRAEEAGGADSLDQADAREETETAVASVACGGEAQTLLPSDLIEVWNKYTSPSWITEEQ